MGGSARGEQNYRAAVIAFAIALAVAGAGYLIYRAVTTHEHYVPMEQRGEHLHLTSAE